MSIAIKSVMLKTEF